MNCTGFIEEDLSFIIGYHWHLEDIRISVFSFLASALKSFFEYIVNKDNVRSEESLV